jgi:DnaJ-class molecular chaperone
MDGAELAELEAWLEALDTLSHYGLFAMDPAASHDDLRAAFHAFADTFHPDGHVGRPDAEQEAIGRIYRRGTEAWRVLSDATLRARYDEALASGVDRPDAAVVAMEAGRSLAPASGRLIDTIRSPGARPFVLRAEELMKKGDPKQAKIQVMMALSREVGNAMLESFAKQIDDAIALKATAGRR